MGQTDLYIDGTTKDFLRVISKKVGRSAPITRNNTPIPGKAGAHPQGKEVGVRPISVTLDIQAASKMDWLEKYDEVVAWLDSEDDQELEFGSEPGRFYKVKLEGEVETREMGKYGQLVVSFICEDPYVYRNTHTADFVDGLATGYNRGTADAPPSIYAVISEPITYIDVWTGKAYMRLGKPVEIGQTTVDPETRLLNDNMSTLNLWTATGTAIDGGTITGNIYSNGYSFRAQSFGTGTAWHGPALKKPVPQGPVTDFSVEMSLIFINENSSTRGRVELYLIDEQGSVIGKVAMKRVGGGASGNYVEVRIGDMNGVFMLSTAGSKGIEWLDFRGIIRFSRKNDIFECYVARVDPVTKKHTARASARYDDSKAKKFAKNLAQVQLHFGQSGTTPTPDMAVGGLKIDRFNAPSEGVPVIARMDDIIEMDFAKGQTFINGEPIQNRADIKRELAAQYFKLPPGHTPVMIAPFDKMKEASISVRGRSK